MPATIRTATPDDLPRLLELWWQLAEYTFDGFMIRQRGRG